MINSGTYATITLDSIISAAKMELKIQDSADYDILFEKWANQAAGTQGLHTLSTTIKKQCSITVNGGKAKLPVGFNQLIAMRYNTNNVSNSSLNCTPMLYVDMAFLSNCGCDTNTPFIQNMQGVFQINNGYIIFYGGVPDGVTCSLSYFANNVDENGLQIVYERYERALTAYLCYRYMLQNLQEYNQYAMETFRQEWMAQKRMLRSQDARESFNNTKYQMMEVANALVVDKSWAAQYTQ